MKEIFIEQDGIAAGDELERPPGVSVVLHVLNRRHQDKTGKTPEDLRKLVEEGLLKPGLKAPQPEMPLWYLMCWYFGEAIRRKLSQVKKARLVNDIG